MHSMQVIFGGFTLWATALLLRTLAAQLGSGALCIAFCLIWFAVSGVNMALGMRYAGYAFADELPFFVLVFSVPVVAAVATTGLMAATLRGGSVMSDDPVGGSPFYLSSGSSAPARAAGAAFVR